jgi:hypothetical protein
MSGAYKLRTAAGGDAFAASWDAALALHHRRNPKPEPRGRPSRGEILGGVGRKPWPAAAATPPEGWVDPKLYYLTPEEFAAGILRSYRLKLEQEREARLAGHIVAADFYVRQLTCLEVVLDLGGNALELLEQLKRGQRHPSEIAATPMSVLLDHVRRAYWAQLGEPERPPLPPLGDHDGEIATGEPSHCSYTPASQGPEDEWRRRETEKAAFHAEAQRAWEEKARAEAEAWAEREAERSTGSKPNDS